MSTIVHTLHVVSAGMWLGGIVFTTAVITPALKAMGWDEVERVGVRSVIGRQYAKVGGANLALLMIFALLDGWTAGFGTSLYIEFVLLAALLCLVGAHGGYLGRRLVELADAEKKAGEPKSARSYAGRRRALQKVSVRVSLLTMALSVAVAVLSVNT